MNFRPLVLAFGLALALPAAAVTVGYAYDFSPRTGDSLMDRQLDDINVYASGHSGDFIDGVVVTWGAPRDLVQDLYSVRRWAPGDIYYACALASALRRPCREIVDIYDRDRGQGWGVIAQRLGIKPGSAEFHALKGRVGKGHGGMHGGGKVPPKGASAHGGGSGQGAAAQGGGKPDRGAQGGQSGGDKGKGKGKGKG